MVGLDPAPPPAGLPALAAPQVGLLRHRTATRWAGEDGHAWGPGSAGLCVPRAPTSVLVRRGAPWSPAFGGPHCIWGAGGWRGLRGKPTVVPTQDTLGRASPCAAPGGPRCLHWGYRGRWEHHCLSPGGPGSPGAEPRRQSRPQPMGHQGAHPCAPPGVAPPGKGPPRSRRKSPLVTRVSEPLGLPDKAHFFLTGTGSRQPRFQARLMVSPCPRTS